MHTSVDRARSGPAGAKARQGLTDAKLRDMPPRERAHKVSDGGNGLCVVISRSGSRSFRYDYRLGGRRETPTIERHEPVARHAQRSHLAQMLSAIALPWLRGTALMVAVFSAASFIVVAMAVGGYNPAIGRVVVADVVAPVLLAAGLVAERWLIGRKPA